MSFKYYLQKGLEIIRIWLELKYHIRCWGPSIQSQRIVSRHFREVIHRLTMNLNKDMNFLILKKIKVATILVGLEDCTF